MLRTLLTAVMALAVAAPAVAASPRDRLLVSPEWLARRLDDPRLVILQVGDKAAYDKAHIPGARFVNLAELAAPPAGPEPLTLQMPEPEALRAKLASLGVSDRSRIVIVPSRDIQSATRVVFTLDAAGLGRRTVLLNGGMAMWTKAGLPVSADAPVAAPGKLSPLRMRPLVVDADFVKRHLGAPGYVVVDARTPDFYAGERTGGSPARPHKTGHIKGARSVPLTTVTTPDLQLAAAEEIAARFKAAGVKKGDTVITYCHVGQQATATLFAARTLGIDVLLYDGSFEEWSRGDGLVAATP